MHLNLITESYFVFFCCVLFCFVSLKGLLDFIRSYSHIYQRGYQRSRYIVIKSITEIYSCQKIVDLKYSNLLAGINITVEQFLYSSFHKAVFLASA